MRKVNRLGAIQRKFFQCVLLVFGNGRLEEHMETSFAGNTHITSLLLHFLKHVTNLVLISLLAIFFKATDTIL